MTLNMETAHPMLQIAVGICVITFLVAFVLALYSTLLVITRTRTLIGAEDDRRLSDGEPLGKRNSRFNTFLVDQKFQSLRILHYGAWATAMTSFLMLFILILVFGKAAQP